MPESYLCRYTKPAFSPTGRIASVALLDTGVASDNLGDAVIMEAVRNELQELFSDRLIYTVASHEWMGRLSRRHLKNSDIAIAGGTNLVSSHMWIRQNWKVTPLDAFLGRKVVLMGVGWYQYQSGPDPYSAWLLRRLLDPSRLHSVRESFAQYRLQRLGFDNVVNTGCPTIWRLTPEHCASLPIRKAQSVVTAVNSYGGLQSPEADRRMLELLKQEYENVYLWIQTFSDYEYAKSLADGIEFINPNVRSLDAIFDSSLDLDYVGTRLHAGIRALQRGRRAIILEIDNRAKEMGKDFGLPTIPRGDDERLVRAIRDPEPIAVRPPVEAITRWRDQFRNNGAD